MCCAHHVTMFYIYLYPHSIIPCTMQVELFHSIMCCKHKHSSKQTSWHRQRSSEKGLFRNLSGGQAQNRQPEANNTQPAEPSSTPCFRRGGASRNQRLWPSASSLGAQDLSFRLFFNKAWLQYYLSPSDATTATATKFSAGLTSPCPYLKPRPNPRQCRNTTNESQLHCKELYDLVVSSKCRTPMVLRKLVTTNH